MNKGEWPCCSCSACVGTRGLRVGGQNRAFSRWRRDVIPLLFLFWAVFLQKWIQGFFEWSVTGLGLWAQQVLLRYVAQVCWRVGDRKGALNWLPSGDSNGKIWMGCNSHFCNSVLSA